MTEREHPFRRACTAAAQSENIKLSIWEFEGKIVAHSGITKRKGYMPTGTVKRYFDERGFGFLKPEGAGQELFFHVKSFAEHVEPHVGDRVEFELGADPKSGRARAQNLTLI